LRNRRFESIFLQRRVSNELFPPAASAAPADGRIGEYNFAGQYQQSPDFLHTELDRVGTAHADLCGDFSFSRCRARTLFFEAADTT
jgi:hypothetical protein